MAPAFVRSSTATSSPLVALASAPMTDIRTLPVTAELIDYAVAHGSWPVDEVLAELREETLALGGAAGMQIGPDQGQLLTLFTRLVGARRAVEVGTFTGYSSLCIARGLADGGTLLCCDVSEEWTAIARRAWARAGVADRIDLRIAPATETLRSLPAGEHVDLAFIDADKGGYIDYWNELVPRVRPGGVLLVDNVLWSGAIADPSNTEPNTVALRAFNDAVAADERVDVVILPAFDGLTIARKR
jgi:caffeoyl-CoA O-methyltransferase